MIGFCTSIENADELADLGFDYVETTCAALADEAVPAKRIPLFALNNLIPRNLSIYGDAESFDQILENVESSFALAKTRNVRTITLGSGSSRRTESATPSEFESKRWTQLLQFVDSLSAKTGIKAGLESLTRGETNFINSLEHAAMTIDENACTNIGLTVDSFHFFENKDSYDSIKKYSDKIVHIHIADDDRGSPKTISRRLKTFLDKITQYSDCRELAIETDWRIDFEPHESIITELRKYGF